MLSYHVRSHSLRRFEEPGTSRSLSREFGRVESKLRSGKEKDSRPGMSNVRWWTVT